MQTAKSSSGIKVDEWMLWVAAAGVGLTFVLGLFSIMFALLANGKAKRANEIAGKANDIAKGAREDARAASTDARWAEALLLLLSSTSTP